MPEKTWDKKIESVQQNTQVKSFDFVLTGMIVCSIITIVVWVTLFMTFGRNVEQLKVEVNRTSAHIRHIDEQIQLIDKEIENYTEILIFLDIK